MKHKTIQQLRGMGEQIQGGIQMSELKAGVIVTPHDEGMCFNRDSDVIAVTERETEFYLKSEADKVIAELKAQKAQAKTFLEDAASAMHETEEYARKLYKEAQHHKYKRCLDMAELCNEKWLVHNFEKIPTKLGFYGKWHKRWLELAEKFKEAK